MPPSNPVQEAEGVSQELEILRAELAASQAAKHALAGQAAIAQAQAEEEAALRQLAEQFMQEAESRAEDAQAQIAEISEQFQAQLKAMQAVAVQAPAQAIQQLVTAGQLDEDNLDLDERATRKLIDLKLREAGWEVDSEMLTYAKGLRPQKGKNLAIAEWPTADGRADYILFAGLAVVGAIEAKRRSKDVPGAIDQAKRYSRDYVIKGDEQLVGGSWGEDGQRYQIPFVFSTNGRAYHKQLETKSGIWFCDVRQGDMRRAIGSWYRPEGLNEVSPRVAVTVDLMTTGIDVPSICNLVFLRRVKSRILYEQMLGRATRQCDDLGDGSRKEVFKVFDAVDLYSAIQNFTTMKPVVVNPKISFGQLVDELGQVQKPDALEEILDQLQAKLQRKRRHLSETQRETLEGLAGMSLEEMAEHLKELRQQSPAEAAAWLTQRRQIAELLDRKDGGRQIKLYSEHPDELVSMEQGYRVVSA